jgi:hypothetical protein
MMRDSEVPASSLWGKCERVNDGTRTGAAMVNTEFSSRLFKIHPELRTRVTFPQQIASDFQSGILCWNPTLFFMGLVEIGRYCLGRVCNHTTSKRGSAFALSFQQLR